MTLLVSSPVHTTSSRGSALQRESPSRRSEKMRKMAWDIRPAVRVTGFLAALSCSADSAATMGTAQLNAVTLELGHERILWG